jgi:hypothetical protein
MKFELIKKIEGLEMYDDIPCLPIDNLTDEGERFIGEETDSWILLDYFVPILDMKCENELDYGDVEYFDKEKCKIIKSLLEKQMKKELDKRLQVLYEKLYDYVVQAIELGTGVVIGL